METIKSNFLEIAKTYFKISIIPILYLVFDFSIFNLTAAFLAISTSLISIYIMVFKSFKLTAAHKKFTKKKFIFPTSVFLVYGITILVLIICAIYLGGKAIAYCVVFLLIQKPAYYLWLKHKKP